MNPANPKLSPTPAASVVCGFGDLWKDLALLPYRGQYPGFFSPTTLGYLDSDGYLTSTSAGRIFATPFNTVALGGSRWIGVNTAQQTAYLWTGEVVEDAYCPAISPNGAHWACLLGNTALDHPVLVDGVPVTSNVIDDKLSITDDGTIVYSIFESGLQQTWGKRPGLPPQRLRATYQAYEVDPVAVQLPDGALWVVSHDDTRTLARPWGSTLGYLLPGAKTPHAVAVDQTHIRVVGDLETSLLDVTLDLTLPRTALNVDPSEPPIVPTPSPAGYVVERPWEFIAGTDPSFWPRMSPDGQHRMHCVRSDNGQTATFIKGENPRWWERWSHFDGMVRHVEDHWDRPDSQAYWFSSTPSTEDAGPWVPNLVIIGETVVDCGGNFLRDVLQDGTLKPWFPLAYRIRSFVHYAAYDFGGDIGVDEALGWVYDPGGNDDIFEPMLCSRRAGWTVWAEHDQSTRAEIKRSFWNTRGGASPQPINATRPWPPQPEPEPEPMKPYDEAFYLNTAPPMQAGDPSGATAQAIADYAAMGRPVDGQYAVWFTRTEHDYQGGMSLPASWKKHRNEMRALLNPAGDLLPPFP